MSRHGCVNQIHLVPRRLIILSKREDIAVFNGAVGLDQVMTQLIKVRTTHSKRSSRHGSSPEQRRLCRVGGGRESHGGEWAVRRKERIWPVLGLETLQRKHCDGKTFLLDQRRDMAFIYRRHVIQIISESFV